MLQLVVDPPNVVVAERISRAAASRILEWEERLSRDLSDAGSSNYLKRTNGASRMREARVILSELRALQDAMAASALATHADAWFTKHPGSREPFRFLLGNYGPLHGGGRGTRGHRSDPIILIARNGSVRIGNGSYSHCHHTIARIQIQVYPIQLRRELVGI